MLEAIPTDLCENCPNNQQRISDSILSSELKKSSINHCCLPHLFFMQDLTIGEQQWTMFCSDIMNLSVPRDLNYSFSKKVDYMTFEYFVRRNKLKNVTEQGSMFNSMMIMGAVDEQFPLSLHF